jgi:hypothetical protein
LAGSVQGVVVQITANRFFPRSDGWRSSSLACSAAARGKRTSMDGLTWASSYSTSASARAVLQEMHQYTDFLAL